MQIELSLVLLYKGQPLFLDMLDMGMKPALGREMARYTGAAHNAQSIRDLLRSIEIIGLAIVGLIVLGIWSVSGWLATDWLTVKSRPLVLPI